MSSIGDKANGGRFGILVWSGSCERVYETFLKERKKLWLAPVVLVMIILGGLLIMAQGSVVAPFIYTLF